jgi:hypothetical protein
MLLVIGVGACTRPQSASIAALPPAQLDVRLDSGEADAALAIVDKQVQAQPISKQDWDRLFASDGYVHLHEREAAMKRAFTDSSFIAFLMSDTLLPGLGNICLSALRFARDCTWRSSPVRTLSSSRVEIPFLPFFSMWIPERIRRSSRTRYRTSCITLA